MELVSVDKRLDENDISPPTLNILSGIHPDVMQFQPKAEIIYDPDTGSSYEKGNELMSKKLNCFLHLAKTEKSALVIAPECCVTFEFLKDFIAKDENWPEKGKLWCLGMAFVTPDDFTKFVADIDNSNVKCIQVPPESIKDPEKLCNSLMYVFVAQSKDGDDKLILLSQLKNNPSKTEPETSQGSEVYYFKNDQSLLSTLICSDGFMPDLNKFNGDKFYGYKKLIIHIQLTVAPLHSNNEDMIETLLELKRQEGNRTRIIGVNWSHGTIIKENDVTVEKIYHGHSAFYKKRSQELKHKDVVNEQIYGFCRGEWGFATKWHLPFEEHVIHYRICTFIPIDAASAINHEPEGLMLYRFEDETGELIEWSDYCAIDWTWMKTTFGLDCQNPNMSPLVPPFIDSFYYKDEGSNFLGMRTEDIENIFCCAYRLPSDIKKDAKVVFNRRQNLKMISEFFKKTKPKGCSDNSKFSLQDACDGYNFVDENDGGRILFVDNETDAVRLLSNSPRFGRNKRELIKRTRCCYQTVDGFKYYDDESSPVDILKKNKEDTNSVWAANPLPSADVSFSGWQGWLSQDILNSDNAMKEHN